MGGHVQRHLWLDSDSEGAGRCHCGWEIRVFYCGLPDIAALKEQVRTVKGRERALRLPVSVLGLHIGGIIDPPLSSVLQRKGDRINLRGW